MIDDSKPILWIPGVVTLPLDELEVEIAPWQAKLREKIGLPRIMEGDTVYHCPPPLMIDEKGRAAT